MTWLKLRLGGEGIGAKICKRGRGAAAGGRGNKDWNKETVKLRRVVGLVSSAGANGGRKGKRGKRFPAESGLEEGFALVKALVNRQPFWGLLWEWAACVTSGVPNWSRVVTQLEPENSARRFLSLKVTLAASGGDS